MLVHSSGFNTISISFQIPDLLLQRPQIKSSFISPTDGECNRNISKPPTVTCYECVESNCNSLPAGRVPLNIITFNIIFPTYENHLDRLIYSDSQLIPSSTPNPSVALLDLKSGPQDNGPYYMCHGRSVILCNSSSRATSCSFNAIPRSILLAKKRMGRRLFLIA